MQSRSPRNMAVMHHKHVRPHILGMRGCALLVVARVCLHQALPGFVCRSTWSRKQYFESYHLDLFTSAEAAWGPSTGPLGCVHEYQYHHIFTVEFVGVKCNRIYKCQLKCNRSASSFHLSVMRMQDMQEKHGINVNLCSVNFWG